VESIDSIRVGVSWVAVLEAPLKPPAYITAAPEQQVVRESSTI